MGSTKSYSFFFLIGGKVDHVETYDLYNDLHARDLARALLDCSGVPEVEVWNGRHLVASLTSEIPYAA